MIWLETLFIKRIKEIDRSILVGFIVAIISGIVCHIYCYTGDYPAYSGVTSFINDSKIYVPQGRWLAALLIELNGGVTIPFIIGVQYIIGMAVACALSLDLLEVNNYISITLFSCIFMTFPVWASRNYFIHNANGYGVSCMLAVMGVWLCKKKKAWIRASLCFFLSLSAYQADMSMAFMSICILVILDLISGNIRNVIVEYVKTLISIIVGFILYHIIYKSLVFFMGIESYRKYDLNLAGLLKGVKVCYVNILWFFGDVFTKDGMGVVVLGLLLVSLFMVVIVSLSKTTERKVRVFFFVAILLFSPVLVGYMFLAVPNEAPTSRVFVAAVYYFLLPVVMCQRFKCKVFDYVVLLLSLVTIVFGIGKCNVAYMNMHLQYERGYSLALRVVDRIESTPGYVPGMKVVFTYNNGQEHYEEGYTDELLHSLEGIDARGYCMIADDVTLSKFITRYILTNMQIRVEYTEKSIRKSLEPFPSIKCTCIEDNCLYFRVN